MQKREQQRQHLRAIAVLQGCLVSHWAAVARLEQECERLIAVGHAIERKVQP